MNGSLPSIAFVILSTLSLVPAGADEDPLAAWRAGVKIHPVSPDGERHVIHSYFNTSPESPDGKYVLYYTSSTPEGEAGDLRILERSTGKETVMATGISTEDAHRAACQQWANGGKTVVYHDCREGRWCVVAVDLATRKQKVLAWDHQLGFGSSGTPWVPVYGCHWNPGPHRDLELIHVETGEIQKPITAADVVEVYSGQVERIFGTKDISIFFPVMSPDGEKVFFKLSRPGGGTDFRSKTASSREGKVVYDLANRRFIRFIDRWGHPSWDPSSTGIFEIGNELMDLETGKTRRPAPSSISNHPSIAPDGRVFVTDADVTKRPFGQSGYWAIAVGSMSEDDFVVLTVFDNTQGAKTWRHNHPHPAFSPDGKRIYYNVNDGPWTRLVVAESKATE